MKKFICILLSVICALSVAGCKKSASSASGESESAHTHNYVLVKAQNPTCTEDGYSMHYVCDCGKIFLKKGTVYNETSADKIILKKRGHDFGKETVSDEYFISEATETVPQVYAKSCFACGKKSESETFFYGKTLAEYHNADKRLYTPACLTVTLYDAENCVYGFTWDTKAEPARPVLAIRRKSDAENQILRAGYAAASSKALVDEKDADIKYYSCKATVKLQLDTDYVYSVGDKYVGTFTVDTEIKSVNPQESGSWKFVHVSDSQAAGNVADGGKGTYAAFGKVLKAVDETDDVRFMVHTGDVVEYSKYQSYWENMLDENFAYLSKIPVMAISGNHETTYRNGVNETFNRFNYKIPTQNTDLGFYYSYSYGGVRFIMLNTNNLTNSALTADQYSWLKSQLKEKTERWTVVAMHNPMYSVGKWGSDTNKNTISLALTAQLQGLFAEYKVDVVLQGHDHMISRTHPLDGEGKATEEKIEKAGDKEYITDPNGVIYVMNGPAGDQARGEVFEHDKSLYAYARTSNASSWAEFTVSNDLLSVVVKTAYSGDVKIVAEWGIKKTA